VRALLASLFLAGTLVAVFWAGADAGARSERALRARISEAQTAAPNELEAALAIPDAGARASALASLLQKAGAEDVEAAFRVLETTNLPVDAVAVLLVTDWAASFDPHDALRRAVALEHSESSAAVSAALRRWARQEPDEALRFAESIHDPRGTDRLFQALVMGWAERVGDPAPWSYVRNLPMGPSRQKLIRTLVGRKLVLEGVEPTLRFVESIPDDAARRFKLQVFRRTARALARQDPELAVKWAQRHSDGPHGDGLLRKVGTARVVLEGAPGFAWLRDVEAGPQRDEAVLETYRLWLSRDRAGAMNWLRDAPSEPAFEPALVMLVGATARTDPAEALELLPRIQDPGLLQSAKLRLGRLWLARDEPAARDWIRQSGLSEELQTELFERGPAGRAPPSRE